MPDAAQTGLLPAREVVRTTVLATAANGLRYTSFGYTEVPADSLKQIVEAVPPSLASALAARAYYFVPLAIGDLDEAPRLGHNAVESTLEIARGYTPDLGDRATCHRNLAADGVDCTFISARLMQDRFALAFEFFINIGHQLVDAAGVPRPFAELAWAQARAEVRGETSQDAYESRVRALDAVAGTGLGTGKASPEEPDDDPAAGMPAGLPARMAASPGKASGMPAASLAQNGSAHVRPGSNLVSLFASRDPEAALTPRASFSNSRQDNGRGDFSAAVSASLASAEAESPTDEQTVYFEAAFADTLAIYMLSLSMDLDYADLREREYPLLAAPALADRLRLAAELFPAAAGYEFSIRYRAGTKGLTGMIAHLRGNLLTKLATQAIVEAGGVGYDVAITIPTFTALPAEGGEVALYIHTQVREDTLALFGFLALSEKRLFERLITVTGVGPKLAMTILSGLTPETTKAAIRAQDHATLTRIPGVGKRLAERLVVELKDKLDELAAPSPAAQQAGPAADDVLSALVNLGYQRAAAQKAIDAVSLKEKAAASDFDTLFRATMLLIR